MNYVWFIGQRIIRKKERNKTVARPTVRLAIAGVTLGLAVMILTMAIVRGFQNSISNKVEGFDADIQITNMDNNNSLEPLPVERHQTFLSALSRTHGVKHVEVFATKNGIIKTKSDNEGVILKGVGTDYNWEFIKNNLVKGIVFSANDSLPSTRIILSQTIASELGADTGTRLHIFFVTRTKDSSSGYEQRVKTFKVQGIYNTGLDDFDRQVVFVDIGQIQNLNYWNHNQVAGFEVECNSINDAGDMEPVINDLIGQTLEAKSLKKINYALFSWLEIQDTNAVIIIVLMTIVSVMAMISAFIVLILENTSMIGLLKAVGLANRSIQQIFLFNGAYMVFKGLLAGNLLGISLCLLQSHYNIIKLPQETYYVSYVPVLLNGWSIIKLNILTFSACIMALLLPSLIISRITPMQTLRYN